MGLILEIAFWLLAGLLAYLSTISAYMALIVFGSWAYRPSPAKPSRRFRFAIIIPAHNEEAGIGDTVNQLLQLDYPRSDFRVFVVADNCSDRTAAVAAECGAAVRERHDTVNRGKGQALDWLLRQHRDELAAYDLVAFIDADMQVDRNFLCAMATSFSNDSRDVVQARYTVSPDVSSWREAVGFASFACINHVRPAGRCFWGGTADLKGSGMVFRRELILKTGWPMHSIAEDVEFGKDLLMKGKLVHYEPRAVVTSHIPSTFEQIAVQQARWEGGKAFVFRRFIGPILRSLSRRPSLALLDALLDLLVPPLTVMLMLAVIGAGASAAFDQLPWLSFLLPIAIFGIAVLTGLVQLGAPRRVWVMLAMAPVFVVWKLILLAKVTFGSTETQWRRTPRDMKNP